MIIADANADAGISDDIGEFSCFSRNIYYAPLTHHCEMSEEGGTVCDTTSKRKSSGTPPETADAAAAHKPADVLVDVDVDLPEVL